jgi:4-hydroxybenzoate polyprenyltransferase
MSTFFGRIRLTLDMIKFEHSIFALPFALTGALLAWRDSGFERAGLASKLFWIVVSMVAARSVAMAFNRVLPRDCSRGVSPGDLSCFGLWCSSSRRMN